MIRYAARIFTFLLFIVFSGTNVVAADNSLHLYQQGLEAMKNGNYRSAELLFSKVVLKDDAMRDSAWFSLAKTLYYQKKYTAAVFEFNRFIVMSTNDKMRSESFFWIADSHYQNAQHILAIEEFKRFITETEGFPELKANAYMRIASIYSRQNRFDEALYELNLALDISPSLIQKQNILIKIAETHFLNRNYENAQEIIDELISAAENEQVLYHSRILKSRILLETSKNREALAILYKYDDEHILKNRLFDIYYFRAKAAESIDLDQALADYELYCENVPEGAHTRNARFQTGLILFNRARYNEALPHFVKVTEDALISEHSLRDESLYYSAFILYLAKEYSRARQYLDTIPEEAMNYNNKEYFVLKSDNYVSLGLHDLSEKLLLRMSDSYRYDPELDRILYKLAYTQLLLGKFSQSRSTFEKIRTVDPFSEYIRETSFYIALAYYEQGEYEHANSFFSSYLNSNKSGKNEIDALYYQNATLLKLKQYQKCEHYLRIMCNRYPNNEKTVQAVHQFVIERGSSAAPYFFSFVFTNFTGTWYAYDFLRIRAADSYAKSDYNKAVVLYSIIVNDYEAFSDNEDFYRYLVCKNELGLEKEIIDSLKSHRFKALWNSDKIVPLLAEVYRKQNKTDTSVSLLEFTTNHDNGVIILFMIQNGDYESAFDIYSSLAHTENKFRLFVKIATLLETQKRFALAIPYGEDIIGAQALAARHPAIRSLLCTHSLRCGDIERALQYIPEKHDKITVEDSILRNEVLHCAARYEQVVQEYSRSIVDSSYLSRSLYACIQTGNTRTGAHIAAQLEKSTMKNRETLFSLINWYHFRKDHISLVNLHISTDDPLFLMVNHYIAELAYDNKNFSLFEQSCNTARKYIPNDLYAGRTLYLYSIYLYNNGKTSPAKDILLDLTHSRDVETQTKAVTALKRMNANEN